MRTDDAPEKVAIIGGCGHVGLPLGVRLALAGHPTVLVDIDEEAVASVRGGRWPFRERDARGELAEARSRGLDATSDPGACRGAGAVVFVTGTPVDEHLNPKISEVDRVIDRYLDLIDEGALLVLRSTLFPGATEHVRARLEEAGRRLGLCYCPERVSQGAALEEIENLPQIVAAFDGTDFERAHRLFAGIAPSIIRMGPLEAELAKLMTNSWRYLEFAIANQFYMMAEKSGVDFHRVYQAIRHEYPRAAGYRPPGLAAGPCLFKDTMQLAAFFDHNFHLGHAAMLVNEGLAAFLAEKVEHVLGGPARGRVVGLLGMTFKAGSDDVRESLSFRVRKTLEFKGARVLCHDPYLQGSTPLEELGARAEVLVLCTPHDVYGSFRPTQPVVDVWGVFDRPRLEVLPGTRDPAA